MNEDALFHTLKDGEIGAAGLDARFRNHPMTAYCWSFQTVQSRPTQVQQPMKPAVEWGLW